MRHMGVYLSLLWVSGVYGSSAEPEKVLKCIVGGRVIFPAAVKNRGFITRVQDKNQFAKVMNKSFSITMKNFTGRVQWDNSTGLFSLTGLKMEDSGKYEVQNNDGQNKSDTVYQLKVYNPVSTPQVSSRSKMKLTCSVLCSVENGREVTLSWQREGETLNSTSSPDLNTPLSLPLEIEENSTSYSCVAKNPAINKTVTIKPEEFCLAHCCCSPMAVIGPGVGAGIGVLFILLGIFIFLKKRGKTPGTEDSPEDLTYANINHGARGPQRENAHTGQTGASDDTVYSNVNHKPPKKQKAAAPRATQGESSCVYAEVRRK